MLIRIDASRKVVWYNDIISKEDSKPYLSTSIWMDGITVPAYPKSGDWDLYLTEENTLEYKEVKEPEPTEQKILMQTLADMELSNIESQQERQMLAQQIADLELMILEGGMGNV